MMKGKKGFFFTLIAIALSIVAILSYHLYSEATSQKESATRERVITINNFLLDVEDDLRKGVQIAAIRTLLGIQEHLSEQGEYLSDPKASFKEGIIYGTIEGEQMDILINSTFIDWADRIGTEAEKIGIIANFSITDLSLSQKDPWSINVTVSISFNVTDRSNTASFDREKNISARISILSLEDPLYLIGTSGKSTNTIRQTNFTPLVSGGNVGNLMKHTNSSSYLASNYSPSYLLRLQGNFSPSPLGIESLVNFETLEQNGIITEQKSAVDAIYFGSAQTTDSRINNTPSWFLIDSDHLDFYGVTNLTIP